MWKPIESWPLGYTVEDSHLSFHEAHLPCQDLKFKAGQSENMKFLAWGIPSGTISQDLFIFSFVLFIDDTMSINYSTWFMLHL